MKMLIAIFLGLPFIAQAEYLVYKKTERKIISDKLAKESITLQRRLRSNIKIKHSQLGKRLTPFYYTHQNTFYAVYQSATYGCLRVTVSKEVTAKSWNCAQKISLELENYPEYKLVNAKDLPEFDRAWEVKTYRKAIEGFSFYYFLKDIYMDNNQAPKLDWFKMELIETFSLINSHKSGFVLTKKINFQRDQFHFYPAQNEVKKMSLKIGDRDYVFANQAGELLVYKKYQPAPLDFRLMSIDDNFQAHLDNVDSKLFDYSGKKVCFLDYAIDESKYDCKFNLLNNDTYYRYKKFDLILVDLGREIVNLINILES